MANEATVQCGLIINKGKLSYQSLPQSYQADMSVARGPTPGLVIVPVTGIDIDLSALDQPGLCWMHNLDDTNFVTYGIHDGTAFHPLGELLPGEATTLRLSRNLGEIYEETGTGTTAPVNSLNIRANGGSCSVRVEAFDT